MSSWFRPRPDARHPAHRGVLSLCELDTRVQPAVLDLSSLLTGRVALGSVAEVSLGAATPGTAGAADQSPAAPGLLGTVTGLLGTVTGPLVDLTGDTVSGILGTTTALVRPGGEPAEAPPVGSANPETPGADPAPQIPAAGEPPPAPPQSPGEPAGEALPPGPPVRPAVPTGGAEVPAAEVAPPTATPVAPVTQVVPSAASEPATAGAPAGPAPTAPAAQPGSESPTAPAQTPPADGSELITLTRAVDAVEQPFSGSATAAEPATVAGRGADELNVAPGVEPLPATDAVDSTVTSLPEPAGAANDGVTRTPESANTTEAAAAGGEVGGVSAGTARADGGPPDTLPAGSQAAAGDAVSDGPAAPGVSAPGSDPAALAVEAAARALAYVAEAAGLPVQVLPEDLSSVQAELDAYLSELEGVVAGIDPGPEGRWGLVVAAGVAGFYLEWRRAKRRVPADGLPEAA